MAEWCMIYKSWASMLTGYPTVIDCRPGKGLEPKKAIEELYLLLREYSQDPRQLPEYAREAPELIGQRFLVYKAYGGDRKNPTYEIRAVLDQKTLELIWMGGVYQSIIHGAPSKPPKEPKLPPLPDEIDPPKAPEGQKIIRKPVVYSAEGPYPEIKATYINLGYYDEELPKPEISIEIDYELTRPVKTDFHCVTGWSVGGIEWRGVRLLDILEQNDLKGKWILAVSHGGYTTVFPYDKRILENAMLVTHLGEKPLPREHGGPYRLIIPRLYGWKSLKWLQAILVGDVYLDGYWEARGYHWRGLIVLNERFKRYE